jgi:pheromone shutdown-related protein TraB
VDVGLLQSESGSLGIDRPTERLPEQNMNESVNTHRFFADDKEFILVGTAHVSKTSADLAGRIIEEERPETVCLELCTSRYLSLVGGGGSARMTISDMFGGGGDWTLLLSSALLIFFQKRVGDKLGVEPGAEMRRSIDAANAVGAEIRLIDREARTTLLRAWTPMRGKDKMRLLREFFAALKETAALKEKDIEDMKRGDVVERLVEEFGDAFPWLRHVLIDERDMYLSYKIRTSPGRKIVAVVGAAHVPGILSNWDKPVDIEKLERIPPRK